MIECIELLPDMKIRNKYIAQDENDLIRHICETHLCNMTSCPFYKTPLHMEAEKYINQKPVLKHYACKYYSERIFIDQYISRNKYKEIQKFNSVWEDTLFIIEYENRLEITYKTNMPWYKRLYIYLKNKRFLDHYGARWI